jgi:hypothetical protein
MSQRISLTSGIKKLEAEVGPLKYIAEMAYSSTSTDQLDRAVRMVILLLVSVFDPLAVLLLLAANQGLSKNELTNPTKRDSILRIDNTVLGEDNVVERKTT